MTDRGNALPAFRLHVVPVDATPDDYWAEVGFDESGRPFLDSIHAMAQAVAVTGPSGRWGCWGERDPEVAVVRGFPDEAARQEWCARYGPGVDAAGALEFWLPRTFRGRTFDCAEPVRLAAFWCEVPGYVMPRSRRALPRGRSTTARCRPRMRTTSRALILRVWPRGRATPCIA